MLGIFSQFPIHPVMRKNLGIFRKGRALMAQITRCIIEQHYINDIYLFKAVDCSTS